MSKPLVCLESLVSTNPLVICFKDNHAQLMIKKCTFWFCGSVMVLKAVGCDRAWLWCVVYTTAEGLLSWTSEYKFQSKSVKRCKFNDSTVENVFTRNTNKRLWNQKRDGGWIFQNHTWTRSQNSRDLENTTFQKGCQGQYVKRDKRHGLYNFIIAIPYAKFELSLTSYRMLVVRSAPSKVESARSRMASIDGGATEVYIYYLLQQQRFQTSFI